MDPELLKNPFPFRPFASLREKFRLDRFLTLCFFRPLMRPTPGKAAILMYHSISDCNESVHPYYQICTCPTVFDKQMRFLHEKGYQIIDLMALVENMKVGKEIAPQSVVLTFDDGFRDFYTNAFPVLQKYGFSATVFLATGFIDEAAPFKGRECLTWAQVRELRKYGISFGSHTVSHRMLSAITKSEVNFELVRSKERIESELGEKIESFCYPFAFPETDGAHIESLLAILGKTGYRCGVSTRVGTTSKGDDVFCLKRLPVNSLDEASFFRAKLEGGYDWLHTFQVIYKRLQPHRNATAHSTPIPDSTAVR